MKSTTRASGATGARCSWSSPGRARQVHGGPPGFTGVRQQRTCSRARVDTRLSFQTTSALNLRSWNRTCPRSSPNRRPPPPGRTVSLATVVPFPVATSRPPVIRGCAGGSSSRKYWSVFIRALLAARLRQNTRANVHAENRRPFLLGLLISRQPPTTPRPRSEAVRVRFCMCTCAGALTVSSSSQLFLWRKKATWVWSSCWSCSWWSSWQPSSPSSWLCGEAPLLSCVTRTRALTAAAL